MKHITFNVEDVPPMPIVGDRRISLDRRVIWRGGRRDSDWTTRPPNAWAQLAAAPSPRWRAVLSTLNLLS